MSEAKNVFDEEERVVELLDSMDGLCETCSDDANVFIRHTILDSKTNEEHVEVEKLCYRHAHEDLDEFVND